ncbi:hypothetical protein [Undibacterium curvum]|uniref:Uncharacterized protein n=1 Tax=Undibacterium curvum TaxID=2762294 RepID=A0ABR7A0B7_9BURK|nr:hypothetical protein [Undibacterium curvum]MBC3930363.1 hypothetical protein [Undibacterium curvum]
MNIKNVMPPATSIVREGLITLGGILLAAFIISRWPQAKKFVESNSLTVKDQAGNTIF